MTTSVHVAIQHHFRGIVMPCENSRLQTQSPAQFSEHHLPMSQIQHYVAHSIPLLLPTRNLL